MISPKSRKIHLSDEQSLYFLLNIMGHDVIHDFGPKAPENRWKNNAIYIKQITSGFTMVNPNRRKKIGGIGEKRAYSDSTGYSMTETIDPTAIIEPRRKILRLKPPSSMLASEPFTPAPTPAPFIAPIGNFQIGTTTTRPIQRSNYLDQELIANNNYNNFLNYVNEYDEYLGTTIMYSFFANFLKYFIENKTTQIPYDFLFIPIVTESESALEDDIYWDLYMRFGGYLIQNGKVGNMNFDIYLNELGEFLSRNNTYMLQTIMENVLAYDDSQIDVDYEMDYMTGGAKHTIDLTQEECRELFTKIEQAFITLDSQLTIMKNTFDNRESANQEAKNEYITLRKNVISVFKEIFREYREEKTAGGIDQPHVIPLIDTRKNTRTSKGYIEDIRHEILNVIMSKYRKIIDDYENSLQRLEEQKQRELEREENAKIREEEKQQKMQEREEKQRQKDLEKLSIGALTSEDEKIRKQFTAFIAKSVLHLNGICDKNGKPSAKTLSYKNVDLRQQINILLFLSNLESSPNNPIWQQIYDKEIQINTQDLDKVLFDHFNKYYSDKKIRIYPKTPDYLSCKNFQKSKYIVNNAANITTTMRNQTFCPYSSILDGMSDCSWKSAYGLIERGNMDFTVTNPSETFYYNGKLDTRSDNPEISKSTIYIKLAGLNIPITSSKELLLKGNDLEAKIVLKNTLSKVIGYITSRDQATLDLLFTQQYGNLFENMFSLFTKDTEGYKQFNSLIFSEILFKGTGDLFQEINCVCAYNGYTMDNYYSDSNNIKSLQKDTIRFFTSGDRPSACRFIFLLKNGIPKEINLKAYGGYYYKDPKNNSYVFFINKHESNQNFCNKGSVGGFKKIRRITKKKLYKNTKKNKTSKK